MLIENANARRSASLVLLMCILVLAVIFSACSGEQDEKTEQDVTEPKEAKSTMANPAAVYCTDLGYDFLVRESAEGGQAGFCIFPDSSECPAWEFFRGECGNEWSYCAKQGFTLETRRDTTAGRSGAYAVCVFDDGSECLEQEFLKGTCKPGQCRKWIMTEGGCVTE